MKYATQEVIEKATVLFWQKGFQAAGMRDIQDALDMRPGSIYARFKSKEGLFQLVVEHYVENSKAKLNAVAEATSPCTALHSFFTQALINPEEYRFMRQCLLVKSITELDVIGEQGKQAVVEGMAALQQCFAGIVSRAIECQELPTSTPVDLAANWLQNQFVGLRAFALMQHDNAAIATMIDKVLIDLKTQWPINRTLNAH